MNKTVTGIIVGSVIGMAAMTALGANSPRTMRKLSRGAQRIQQDMSRKMNEVMAGK